MRVKTKYGPGELLGVDLNNQVPSYKVLLDEHLKEDPNCEYHETQKLEDRIINCISIEIESDTGKTIEFSHEIMIK